ncbi:MAG: NAD-dependent protein deacetylase, SIR2 family [Candidatus Cellulosilyticum pullistercoris]|uniref:NAD-dependent protein deacetylase, SIR2 family n=1 Tax=Candidatus Cellulosilyticum pullistercoris TaxID=2838521 RepID=A0A9E2KC48_9FIRM|nr:NAD-dependent protein deacetylase, SIR2 family [Candidatus Cellulosilyticum pullistercoris]
MESLYQKVKEKIQEADAILIGASNGLSISEGYNIFADNEWFKENFGDFREKYGIRSVLQGAFYYFPKEEEKWRFFSRLISKKSYLEQPSQMMKNLYEIVEKKDYFVLTSNTEDHFVPVGFMQDQVFEMEGKMTQFRCANRCCEDIYDNREAILSMAEVEQKGSIPSHLLPRCPKCEGPMTTNTADSNDFFHTNDFKNKMHAYSRFIQKYHGKKLVILELGIGWRNQMIKEPLMRLTASEPQATYITFNKGEIYIPQEISQKSIGIDGDIASALEGILKAEVK